MQGTSLASDLSLRANGDLSHTRFRRNSPESWEMTDDRPGAVFRQPCRNIAHMALTQVAVPVTTEEDRLLSAGRRPGDKQIRKRMTKCSAPSLD